MSRTVNTGRKTASMVESAIDPVVAFTRTAAANADTNGAAKLVAKEVGIIFLSPAATTDSSRTDDVAFARLLLLASTDATMEDRMGEIIPAFDCDKPLASTCLRLGSIHREMIVSETTLSALMEFFV